MCLQAALQHFQALLDGEPQLAGQMGNEQIKTRAASQVLWVSHLRQAGSASAMGWMPCTTRNLGWQVNAQSLPSLAALTCTLCKRKACLLTVVHYATGCRQSGESLRVSSRSWRAGCVAANYLVPVFLTR